MKIKSETFINDINNYAKHNQLFWVCAMAKDCNTILINHLDELHEVARIAVEHYKDEEK